MKKATLEAGVVHGINPEAIARFLAIERRKLWWCRPRAGTILTELEPLSPVRKNSAQIQLFLWETSDGNTRLLLPLVQGDLRSYLTGPPDGTSGLSLVMEGSLSGTAPEFADILLTATGDDPFELVHEAIDAASSLLRTFRPRWKKHAPRFIEDLGWCTWEAFHSHIDADSICAGVDSLKSAGVPIRSVLIDDGWLDVSDADGLRGFEAREDKFPGGLKTLLDNLKVKHQIARVGVWLTMKGYWAGVDTAEKRWDRYRTIVASGPLKSLKGVPLHDARFIDPADASSFFHDWFAFLRSQGVDFVKVDGQSNMEKFTSGILGRAGAMRSYQQAVQTGASRHFENSLIACMCHGNDALFAFESTPVIRNSPDYSANLKHDHFHHDHIAINAANSLLIGSLGWPDWDMFVSTGPAAKFHAMARAISGGPIFIADPPGRHDAELINKLATSDGRILRCSDPANPSRDRLFIDCTKESRLLKLVNTNTGVGVIGLFNCRWHDEPSLRTPITDAFTPADIPGLCGDRFVVYMHGTHQLSLHDIDSSIPVTLDFRDSKIATVSPLVQVGRSWIAPLGLLSKFNGSAAIDHFQVADDHADCRLRDGGEIGFYCSSKPLSISQAGNHGVEHTYSDADGLLVVICPIGSPVNLRLSWS